MSGVDDYWENEQAIDAFVIVHNHLYFMEQSIRREFKQQTGHTIEPERFSLNAFEEMDQQMEHEIEDECVAQRQICYDFWRQCSILRHVCRRILFCACRAMQMGYEDDEQTRAEIAARAVIRLRKRLADEVGVMDEQLRPPKILHRDLPSDTTPNAFDEPVEYVPTPNAFDELVVSMRGCTLDDAMHIKIVNNLLVKDPKRKRLVPSRFCSFHLDGFDLDEKCESLY